MVLPALLRCCTLNISCDSMLKAGSSEGDQSGTFLWKLFFSVAHWTCDVFKLTLYFSERRLPLACSGNNTGLVVGLKQPLGKSSLNANYHMLIRSTQTAGNLVQLLRLVIKMFTDVRNCVSTKFEIFKEWNGRSTNFRFSAIAKHSM